MHPRRRRIRTRLSLSCVAWGYNGQIPGPVLEARVGDVLEVRLTNRLPEPTSIHWHGLRLPAAMDGTDMVQQPIAPGDSFTYRFRLPDAGVFWYHPHVNETTQLERGLYGAIIVRGLNEPELDAERVLVFGHSFGGAAAVWAASETPLLRASANMDGRLWGDVIERASTKPVLFLLSEEPSAEADGRIAEFTSRALAPVHRAQVSGAVVSHVIPPFEHHALS